MLQLALLRAPSIIVINPGTVQKQIEQGTRQDLENHVLPICWTLTSFSLTLVVSPVVTVVVRRGVTCGQGHFPSCSLSICAYWFTCNLYLLILACMGHAHM
jgi:hypothetical protein